MTKVLAKLAEIRKALIPVAGVVVAAVAVQFGADSTVTLEVTSILSALGVYLVPNAK